MADTICCPKCGGAPVRTSIGMSLSDLKAGDAWMADLEWVTCSACKCYWTEVVKECRQWRQASRREGRQLPYLFGEVQP